MRDISSLIRKVVYDRLNGAVLLNNVEISVYDSVSVPAGAEKPYILLGNFTSTEIGEGSKQSYGQECYLDITAVSLFGNSYGGKLTVDNIMNEITQLVRTRQAGYFDLSPYWQLVSVQMDSTNTNDYLIKDGRIVERTTRFKFNVYEV